MGKHWAKILLLVTIGSCGSGSSALTTSPKILDRIIIQDTYPFVAVMPGYDASSAVSMRHFTNIIQDRGGVLSSIPVTDFSFFRGMPSKILPEMGVVLYEDGLIESLGKVEKDNVRRTYESFDAKFIQITCNYSACAVLKEDGSFFTFGDTLHGGLIYGGRNSPDVGHVMIAASSAAFAALHEDGSVFTWGSFLNGGSINDNGNGNFKSVVGSFSSFAGLKNDKTIHCWGVPNSITNCPMIRANYRSIVANDHAFTAITEDNKLVTWGRSDHGGSKFLEHNIDYYDHPTEILQIAASARAFAVLFGNGSIISYGQHDLGGNGAPIGTGFTKIIASINGFAALGPDGEIAIWGKSNNELPMVTLDTPKTKGFINIYSSTDFATDSIFVAIHEDQYIYVWGNGILGQYIK